MRYRLGLVLAVAAGVSLPLLALGAGETVTYEEVLAEVERVEISTGSVDVTVRNASGSPRVTAALDARRSFDVTMSGATTRIQVRGNATGVAVRERVDLWIPDGVELEIVVGSADVMIDGLEFRQLVVNAGSSDVSVTDSSGRMTLEAGSGDIALTRAGGTIAVEVQSGEIDLREVSGVRQLSAGSGDIVASGLLIPEGLDVRLGSGDARLDLSHALNELSISLRSGSGDLRVNTTRADRTLNAGDGPITLSVTTGSGDVTVRTE